MATKELNFDFVDNFDEVSTRICRHCIVHGDVCTCRMGKALRLKLTSVAKYARLLAPCKSHRKNCTQFEGGWR